MKLSFGQAHNILQHMQKNRLPTGQTIKSDLLNVKGDAALDVWRIRTELRNTFEPEMQRLQDISEERQKIINKDEQTKGDKKRLEEMEADLDSLSEEEKKVNVPILKAEDIKNVVSVDVLIDLEPVIDFKLPKNGEKEPAEQEVE